jgi:hypothetical protein
MRHFIDIAAILTAVTGVILLIALALTVSPQNRADARHVCPWAVGTCD